MEITWVRLILCGLGSPITLLPAPRLGTPGDLGALVDFWGEEEAGSGLTAPPSRGGDARAFCAPAEQQVVVFPRRQGTGEVRNSLKTHFVSSL